MSATTPSTTVVKHSPGYHAFLWIVFPLAGAAAGWLIAKLPGWAEGKPLPFSGVLEVIYEHSGTWLTVSMIVLGIVGGVFVTLSAYDEVVRVTISDADVEVAVSDNTKSFRRDQVDAVFIEDKSLILLARDTSELVHQKTDHKSATLKTAFEAHGYPWHDSDPHERDFARWVDGVPGLSEHANAILRARQVALDDGKASDIVELHGEATKLGVVIRDVKKRQYWRVAGT